MSSIGFSHKNDRRNGFYIFRQVLVTNHKIVAVPNRRVHMPQISQFVALQVTDRRAMLRVVQNLRTVGRHRRPDVVRIGTIRSQLAAEAVLVEYQLTVLVADISVSHDIRPSFARRQTTHLEAIGRDMRQIALSNRLCTDDTDVLCCKHRRCHEQCGQKCRTLHIIDN